MGIATRALTMTLGVRGIERKEEHLAGKFGSNGKPKHYMYKNIVWYK